MRWQVYRWLNYISFIKSRVNQYTNSCGPQSMILPKDVKFLAEMFPLNYIKINPAARAEQNKRQFIEWHIIWILQEFHIRFCNPWYSIPRQKIGKRRLDYFCLQIDMITLINDYSMKKRGLVVGAIGPRSLSHEFESWQRTLSLSKTLYIMFRKICCTCSDPVSEKRVSFLVFWVTPNPIDKCVNFTCVWGVFRHLHANFTNSLV